MGSLVELAEQLTKKGTTQGVTDQFGICAEPIDEPDDPKEKEPVPKKTTNTNNTSSPATRKQKGWVYYNLNLKTYGITISRKDMSVLIERANRSSEEKAKVKHRLRQMGAKENK